VSERISKPEYYLRIAKTVALRSTCLRSCYGAVIVRDDRILSTGYNGSPRGGLNCVDIGVCGRAGVESRTRFELCRAVHAELNSIMNACESVRGATLYLAGFPWWNSCDLDDTKDKLGEKSYPCKMCLRAIINAGITSICIRDTDCQPVTRPVEWFEFIEREG
jgi:dCMP deaminase